MWALIIIATFSTYGGRNAVAVQQEFTSQELCVQAAKQLTPKINYSGNVEVAQCVYTGVR